MTLRLIETFFFFAVIKDETLARPSMNTAHCFIRLYPQKLAPHEIETGAFNFLLNFDWTALRILKGLHTDRGTLGLPTYRRGWSVLTICPNAEVVCPSAEVVLTFKYR